MLSGRDNGQPWYFAHLAGRVFFLCQPFCVFHIPLSIIHARLLYNTHTPGILSTMAPVVRPTYLLAPNWSNPEDGDIQLGNIVADPFNPDYPLHSDLDHASTLNPVSSVENNWKDVVASFRETQTSLWARIFQVAKVDLEAHRSQASSVGFGMTSLETRVLPKGQLIDKITEWVNFPSVRNALKQRRGLVLRRPVYVVSGVKIARGFRWYDTSSSDTGRGVGAGGLVTPQVGIGGEANVSAQSQRTQSSEADNNIIFAYELVQVRLKGTETVEVKPFQPSAALLSDSDKKKRGEGADEEDEVTADDLDTSDASTDDLVEFANGRELDLDLAQYSWLFHTA